MGAPLPPPSDVRATFTSLCKDDPEQAVRYLYTLGTSSGYIQTEAIERTIRWTADSSYGTLECTINLAKPEKDPRAIAAAAYTVAADINTPRLVHTPQCDLCWENEEFPGTPEHPAKPGLRIAAIELGGERWGLQYSPYAYFTEHCIALSEQHRPMKITAACFERLLDFVDAFPFYFIGSNADLPLVGGSILTHDHFQGGRHTFPLMKAPLERDVVITGMPEVRCGIVKWPSSVLRLTTNDRAALVKAAGHILTVWQNFSFRPCDILAHSDDIPHNTLNPIVHKTGSTYTLDLVLRNNCANQQHPWGIFHPGVELHHIKKENIGLIEIMGLAILPPRLARELPAVERELRAAAHEGTSPQELEARLCAGADTAPHASWAAEILTRRAADLACTADETKGRGCCLILREEVARVFVTILETTGVFKRDATGQAGWDAFIEELQCKR